MKFSSALIAVFATLVSTVSSHTTISFPPPRGHPLNENAAVQDFECISAPLNGGSGCAPKKFPCGGYPKDKKIVTTFNAGEVFEVKFFNQNFPELKDEDKQNDQARHNGGICEFALSYDGGESYTVIATYKKTCPDIFFDGWKVKIPENAPSCDSPGDCIFSWSWVNALGNREFYQNCADIKIVGNATEPLPIIDITRANLPPLFEKILTPEGDDSNNGNAIGSGPRKEDVEANLALKIGDGKNKSPPKDDENPKEPKDDENPKEPKDDENPKEPKDDENPKEPKDENPKEPKDDENPKEPKDDENPKEPNDDENPKEPKDENPKEPNDDENPKEPKDDENPKEPKDENPKEPKEDVGKTPEKIPCSENGIMVCGKEGESGEFLTCDNGKMVSRTCPGILICKQNDKSIVCDFLKRR
ncbi:15866_t:CDS:1 [Funneliformis geosporum]|uniref:17081_t:CDS:1 n=1 Tax=Funneliformis geosporum TaxID=1117311 RepID=A0A9W4SCS0_9GLOM|nr:15866_t:CDS:1 [Funneliformis geosporum]CAI2164958.1 17081_t:CDS:1 [Funneliformis geosporum]